MQPVKGRQGRPSKNEGTPFRRGVDVRCPSCGSGYDAAALQVRAGSVRNLPICDYCSLQGGPDGWLDTRRVA